MRKNSSNIFKALCYSAIKTIFPGAILVGLFFWIFWLANVAMQSDKIGLTLLGILFFIVIGFLMSALLNVITSGVFSDIFLNISETYLVVEKKGVNTYEIKERKSDGSGGLLFAVFFGVIVGVLSVPLFLISLIRIIFSKKLRIIYNEYLDDLWSDIKSEIKYEKKAFSIIIIIAILCFVPTTIYTAYIHQKYNIDIFESFKDPSENDKEYLKPTLKATYMSVYKGGYYSNGFIVQVNVRFSYTGDIDIIGISGIICIYNPNRNKLLETNCSFNLIENNQTQILYIDCPNSSSIIELQNYSMYNVSIYYTSNHITYNGGKMISENVTYKIN